MYLAYRFNFRPHWDVGMSWALGRTRGKVIRREARLICSITEAWDKHTPITQALLR